MARPRKTASHQDLPFEGMSLEWQFPPWRRPNHGDQSIFRLRPILRQGETLRQAFETDRAERKRLARSLPQLTHYRRFFNLCFDACWIYQFQLQKRTLPRPPESRARLQNLASALGKAKLAIDLLHEVEIRSMETEASREDGRQDPWKHLEFGSLDIWGAARLRHASEMVSRLDGWTRQAAAGIAASKGRPRQEAEREFVAGLRDAWFDQTGALPGITRDWDSGEGRGAFLELCRDLARPINDLMGMTAPDFDAVAKEVLADSKG